MGAEFKSLRLRHWFFLHRRLGDVAHPAESPTGERSLGARCPSVIRVAGVEHFFDVALSPQAQRGQRFAQCLSEGGQLVFHTGRHLVVRGARQDSVPLQIAQRLREDFAADAADLAPDRSAGNATPVIEIDIPVP